MSALTITPTPTPNPNARKFTLNRPVGATLLNFGAPDAAARHPLARDLFAIPDVTNVFLTADFVTVNKHADATWDLLEPQILPILQRHFST